MIYWSVCQHLISTSPSRGEPTVCGQLTCLHATVGPTVPNVAAAVTVQLLYDLAAQVSTTDLPRFALVNPAATQLGISH